MPGLRPLPATKVLQKLKKAGFVETHQRGGHLYLEDGEGHYVTVPVHGSRDIPMKTMHSIVVHQSKLGVERFLAL